MKTLDAFVSWVVGSLGLALIVALVITAGDHWYHQGDKDRVPEELIFSLMAFSALVISSAYGFATLRSQAKITVSREAREANEHSSDREHTYRHPSPRPIHRRRVFPGALFLEKRRQVRRRSERHIHALSSHFA